MTNLVLNSDFRSPLLDTDSFLYYSDELGFVMDTTQQTEMLPWVGSANISLQNGITAFGYPDLSNALSTNAQYVGFQVDASLIQEINITQTGFYSISFWYAKRYDCDLNALQIYFNNVLIDTIDTSAPPNDWIFYTYTFFVNSTGNKVLKFQGQAILGNDVNTAITLVDLTYIEIEPSPNPAPATIYNTISNGSFNSPNVSTTTTAKLTPSFALTSWNYNNSVILCGTYGKFASY